jgi:uncharacterized membrane protein YkvA (DUF1232 family)
MEDKDVNIEGSEELNELDFGGETEEDVNKKIEYVEENLWTKLERVGKKISFAKDILALVRYMRDPQVSWHRKAIVAAALIYFISPIDAIPDITPLIGYLDDLGVITALLKYLGHELIPYYDPSYHA